MSHSDITPTQATNLIHHEPIYLPTSIQPHGVLLGLSSQLEIGWLSNNTQDFLGKQPRELLNQPLSTLLNAEQVKAIEQFCQHQESSVYSFKLSIQTSKGEQYFDAIAHRTQSTVILELEPTDSINQISFLNFHALVQEAIAKMRTTSNLTDFLHLVVSEVQKVTKFDRVMVYQFDQMGAGSVVAEVKRSDLSPYLGLHYPATDIPQQARELYQRCLLRFIPDMNAQPVELLAVENPETHSTPVDLNLSVLRSTHPCCVEYHQNMGVTAILVIALIKEQKLWGLISCHHQAPKHIPYEVRKMCEFLGQIVSLELEHKVNQSELDYKIKLQSLQADFIESISKADNFREALIYPEPRLLDIVNAQGAAVCLDNDITLVGATPTIEEVRALIEWVDTQITDNLFSTDSLPKLYPEAVAFKDTASGLLVLRISKLRRYYILWFRPEVIQTVNWAGQPNEPIQVNPDGSFTLCPRVSFELWQETVRLTSFCWKSCEVESAIALRNAIVGIVLSKADELAKINQDLERSNRDLASFAFAASHDLKEPLRGIYNYSNVLLEDYAQLLDEDGMEYLNTVVSLSVRMETLINSLLRLSLLGQGQLNLQATDLNNLLCQVIDVVRASRTPAQLDIRIPRLMPTIQCEPVLVSEVFSNLIINAFKYNDKQDKWVEIGYLDIHQQPEKRLQQLQPQTSAPYVFYVQDNGIGIPEHHYQTIFRLFKRLHSQEKYGGGTGAGLAISKKIVERHGGLIWVESCVGIGSALYFTL
ncbi:cyanobacterial phytochrome A [Brasilonema octagenarum UFV-E1]|uniref:histidine kinase n=1 Tax=Brasilonema sennae CENA114 TaxID=415709 RepID=A0A856ME75_9CYAN|nr:ATP-binding protein [Brasilonema sennae]QDL08590.1 cyanobacterial phytochrome A [Brasilonema sennae CENA114]QDL14946.1 cyanobacterial phytochrome A [Brasilonema octagenarum UFV-E1]